ncbi:MAG: hypothetical protein IT383_11705 [Deltaproteobacteria bacterium]|nr:hypothetical protein [Deltaproteobacteria bacterium]
MDALRDAVLARGLVTPQDLEALVAWAPYQGARLAERLYRSGLVNDTELMDVFRSLGATDGTDDLLAGTPPPAALGALTRHLADKHRTIGLRVERARLIVGMLDPSDTEALERLTFFCGLAVEPRAIRPRVLFGALFDAYGIPKVLPDAAFLASRRKDAVPHSDEGDALPAPSPDQPVRVFGAVAEPVGDPRSSEIARSVAAMFGSVPDTRPGEGSELTAALEQVLKDTRPSSTPRFPEDRLDDLERLRASMPPASVIEARDSLPPQVLRLLVPPLRSAVLFLVRDSVAVGWDGRTPTEGRERVRDVLLPLTAPSVFERALTWRRVALGNPGDPTTTERTFFRHLALPPPSSLAVLPIIVGERVTALLYVDRGEGMLDDPQIDVARRVGNALADGLAPFVAAGTLFPDTKAPPLPPLPALRA